MFRKLISVALFAYLLAVLGCSKGTEPSESKLVPVQLTLKGETSNTVSFAKLSSQIDSIKINYAIMVLRWIQFKMNIDTVSTDSTFTEEEERKMDDDPSIRFKGPFIVTLRNEQPTPIAVDSLPPGNYNGIKFKVHRLHLRDKEREPSVPDSLIGTSIYVKGWVKQGDMWNDFVFATGKVNNEFKIKGDFTVTEGDLNIPYVLVFDLASWFIDSRTGQLLDPSNPGERGKIISNIKHSLKNISRGGKDRNRDGEPD
jgi:hypothetical protein